MTDSDRTSPSNQASEVLDEFSIGAVALVDALGWKGIWRGPNGSRQTDGLRTLRAAETAARRMTEWYPKIWIDKRAQGVFRQGDVPKCSAVFFSDVMALCATLKRPDDLSNASDADVDASLWTEIAFLREIVCLGAAYAIRRAAQEARPLTFRGAVTVGDIVVDGTHLMGPAVDEAASLMDLPDGAFVWLSERASRVPRPTWLRPNHWESLVHRYRMPLKGGSSVDTFVVSPYVDNGDRAERARIRQGIEKAMASDRVDVVVKRQNTLRFLDDIEASDPPIGG